MQLSADVQTVQVERLLMGSGRRALDALEAVQFRRAQDALDLAGQHTPRRTGRLLRSRYARRSRPIDSGYSAPYAAAVHELETGRGWKFWERGLLDRQRQGNLEAEWRAAFERGETLATAPARYPEQPSAGGGVRPFPTGRR